jgi:hypothetical protein
MTTNDKHTTIDFTAMDFKKFSFSELKQNKYGAHFVNILYDNKIPIVKFPKMMAPFGISAFEDLKNVGVFNYCIETSFDNKNENSGLKDLYEKALKFDEFILKTAAKHHKEWLKDDEKPDMKYLKKQYTPFVKVPTDKKTKKPLDYPSRCKVGFYLNRSGEFAFSCYDAKKNKVLLTKDNYTEHFTNKDEISTARQMRQIWFTPNGAFGVSWDLQQARIYPNESSNVCLLSDDEDSEKSSNSSEISEEISDAEEEEVAEAEEDDEVSDEEE